MLSLELHMAQGLQCLGADWPSDYVKWGLQEVTRVTPVVFFFGIGNDLHFSFSVFFQDKINSLSLTSQIYCRVTQFP